MRKAVFPAMKKRKSDVNKVSEKKASIGNNKGDICALEH